MGRSSQEDAVLVWYNSIFSRRVDLVGDYAGSEIFLVEFDSLLLRCFSNPKLNFSTGFQLLHAVYIVEKLLQDLLSRRCRFQIVCFDQNEDLCVPTNVDRTDYPKYALARSVIFRHLARNLNASNRIMITRFASFTDAKFVQYLNESGTYFVMCHDGAMPDTAESQEPLCTDIKKGLQAHVGCRSCAERIRKVNLRAMISWFIGNQYNVALINELRCADSKAMTVILESSRQQNVRDFGTSYGTAAFHNVPTSGTLALDEVGGIIEPSERDVISIIVLHKAMQDNRILAKEASAFLLHTAALQYLPLGNRRPSITISNTAENLVCSFTQTAASVLRNHKLLEQLDLLNLSVNLADLLDGFLIASLTYDACLRDELLANPAIKRKHDTLLGALVQASGGSFDKKLIMRMTTEYQDPKGLARCVHPIPSNDQNILPFKNAIFDKHLAPVHLHLAGKLSNGSTLENVKVFQELSHWHNHKKAVAMKGLTQKLGFFARRRNDLCGNGGIAIHGGEIEEKVVLLREL